MVGAQAEKYETAPAICSYIVLIVVVYNIICGTAAVPVYMHYL